ncbi:MAG: hypothetical protein RR585_07855 [Coprobacillus sp.]
MKKKSVLFICFIGVFALGMYCFNQHKNQLLKVEISNDYMVADTLNSANNNATYIVKGQFTSYDREWNMHRDDNDLTKEHPYEKITGKIYTFKINDVFKGDVDGSDISINLKYSTRLFFNEDGLLHGEEISNKKNVEHIDYKETVYTEPELNQEYILYLNYDKNFSLYYAAFQPYMIKVDQNQLSIQSRFINDDTIAVNTYQTKNRKIEVKETLEVVNDFVKDISLKEFIDKLEHN